MNPALKARMNQARKSTKKGKQLRKKTKNWTKRSKVA